MASFFKKIILMSSAILIVFSTHLSADSTQSAAEVSTLPRGVSIHQLSNGMQVLLVENPALPMVGVNVVIKVGSAYENFATSGMTHMLEHLLFNGTKNRTQRELYDDVDRIGGYNNANTSDYYTNFMMVTPADKIEKGMEIQADMLFNSILPEDKFAKEKGIVLEEIAKSLAKPERQLERNIQSVLYDNHAISLPTLGTYATIEHMKRDDVFNFYKKHYVPNNMVMSVIGDFETSEMLQTIENLYGSYAPRNIRRSDNPQWGTGFTEGPLQLAQAGSPYHRFYDGDVYKLQLFMPLPAAQPAEYFKLIDIFLERKTDGFNKTLQQAFPNAFKSLNFSTLHNPLAAWVKADLTFNTKSDFRKAVQMLHKALKPIKFNFSDELIADQINKARTFFLQNIEKPHMFGIYNAYDLAVHGIEAVLASYEGTAFSSVRKDLGQLKLDGQNAVVLLQSPAQAATTQQDTVIHGIENQLFKGEKGQADIIVVEHPASHLAAFHFLFKHKAPLEARYGKDAAKVLHEIFGQRLKSDEVKQSSSRFGLAITVNDNPWIPMDNIYLHDDFGYIRIEGLADDMESLTTFIKNQMRGFQPTPEEFEKAMNKLQRSKPMMMGGNKAQKQFNHLYQSAIYETEKYKQKPKLDYESLVEFADVYFQPTNMIISIVAPRDVKKQYQDFADFKGGTSMNTPPYQRSLVIPDEPKQMNQQAGGEQSYLFYGYVKAVAKQDKAALQALSLVLGDRIVFDIREKQGMAYRMSAGIKIKEDKALFRIKMGTRPDNVPKLLNQFPGLLSADYVDDITREELEKSVNMYLGRMMFRRLSSINQAYYLGSSYYLHNDIHYDQKRLDALKQVQLPDVQRVIKKYLQVENPVQVVVR
ncbi:MAG: hypothetical protein GF313_10915 [Caldithrix sp.]|nr:hypothetical protein [Caldithrix sp.]